ncbi:hypothetical protein [Amycolatopsis jiangsuensis]|uniref:Uncharacterized protein n=1 Tax=Amycolatopsis jiangsuensis TaxID=1181879 RepID=A0A840J2M7_9PSEU|nr:hypothetical protein [Amycolatopsis jiangsuensis]MBB4687885.1 hypothetical protein [Amycolatopsis jiangsuensis]
MDLLREKGFTPLRVILAFSVLSTAFHYWHMVVRPRDYPPINGVPEVAGQIAIGAGWVVFTVVAILGYRAYLRERYRRALTLLLVHSLSGVATAGHFLVGIPWLPQVWLIPLVGDVVAAVLVWSFVVWAWSVLNRVSARDQISTQH